MEDWSRHAQQRSAQRCVSREHIELTLLWGREIRQPRGRLAFHLGHREARAARAAGARIPEDAIGVAVVVADDDTIVTVVRSHDRQRLRAHGRSARSAGCR